MRYLITFSYDGNNYYGYQKQLDKITIQETIETNISKILNTKTVISASGRTDSNVHAINQKAHFDGSIKDLSKFKHSLNSLLPEDIYIKDIKEVNKDFHARYNVVKKEYEYRINIGEYDVFNRNYVLQYNNELDIDLMKQALKKLEGTHNFKSLTKSDVEKDFTRTIYESNIKVIDNIVYINVIGNGFLRYMVRNIVGLLIEIASKKRKLEEVDQILQAKDRKKAGITASPVGLYLKNVEY